MSNTRRIESLWVGGRERLTWHSRASSEAAETGGGWRARRTDLCALDEGQGTDCLGLDNSFFLQQRLLLCGAQLSSQTIQVFQVWDLLGVLSTLGNGQQMASRAGYFLDEADGTSHHEQKDAEAQDVVRPLYGELRGGWASSADSESPGCAATRPGRHKALWGNWWRLTQNCASGSSERAEMQRTPWWKWWGKTRQWRTAGRLGRGWRKWIRVEACSTWYGSSSQTGHWRTLPGTPRPPATPRRGRWKPTKSSYFGEARLFLVLSKTRELFIPCVLTKKTLCNVALISVQ